MGQNLKESLGDIVEQLPPLSPSVAKILELANDMTSSPKDLLDIIKIDPVLTGKILKLINSAFYALPNQVTNLNKALILLGFNTIKNLALSTAVLDSLKQDGKHAVDMEQLWDHSLATAVGAKLLAREMGIKRQDAEEYFIGGLLHDIGRVVLAQFAAEDYKKVITRHEFKKGKMIESEMEIMEIDHTMAGKVIAEKWQLPESLKAVIEHHHTDSEEHIVNVVHVADMFAKREGLGLDIDGEHNVRAHAVKTLGLTRENIKNALGNLREEVDKARVLLSA